MNRFRVRLFSVALALLIAAGALPVAVRAQAAPTTTFWFAGTRLIFDSPIALDGDVAVSIRDSGLARLLTRVGATISYAPQQRYVVITSADRRVIGFTIGDVRYTVGGVTASAAFAPFFDANDVILPLYAIARALYVEPIAGGGETVFEPQIGSLDVRPDGRRTIVTLHAATALKYVKVNETPERVSVTFSGVGSALTPRTHVGGGVDEVDVAVAGSAKNPNSTVTLAAPSGAQHVISAGASPYDFTVVFAPPGVALDGSSAPSIPATAPVAAATASASQQIAAMPAPGMPQSGPARITGITIDPQSNGGVSVRLAIAGAAAFDWHRLRDDRWYLDIANAVLTQAGRDEQPESAAVAAVRVRQIGSADAPAVRVAFTLRGENRVDITPAEGSLTIVAGSEPAANVARSGNGQIGGATIVGSTQQSPAGPPVAPIATPAPAASPWKFDPAGASAPGSRIIVIDPGHGGDDIGTAHNGLVEKQLTLDIALRLRALLTRAGWNVRMTRENDVDPVSPSLLTAFAGDGRPNASDRAYLQTRCDVANGANARLFISIHVNYSDATSVRGTTFYYTKPQDVPFAQALERSVVPQAGTQDDGVVKSNLYVTKHTTMPAVLIETAFISNPGDVQLLSDAGFLQNVAAGIAAGVKAYAGAIPAAPRVDQ